MGFGQPVPVQYSAPEQVTATLFFGFFQGWVVVSHCSFFCICRWQILAATVAWKQDFPDWKNTATRQVFNATWPLRSSSGHFCLRRLGSPRNYQKPLFLWNKVGINYWLFSCWDATFPLHFLRLLVLCSQWLAALQREMQKLEPD